MRVYRLHSVRLVGVATAPSAVIETPAVVPPPAPTPVPTPVVAAPVVVPAAAPVKVN